jgi:hypothetical protein
VSYLSALFFTFRLRHLTAPAQRLERAMADPEPITTLNTIAAPAPVALSPTFRLPDDDAAIQPAQPAAKPKPKRMKKPKKKGAASAARVVQAPAPAADPPSTPVLVTASPPTTIVPSIATSPQVTDDSMAAPVLQLIPMFDDADELMGMGNMSDFFTGEGPGYGMPPMPIHAETPPAEESPDASWLQSYSLPPPSSPVVFPALGSIASVPSSFPFPFRSVPALSGQKRPRSPSFSSTPAGGAGPSARAMDLFRQLRVLNESSPIRNTRILGAGQYTRTPSPPPAPMPALLAGFLPKPITPSAVGAASPPQLNGTSLGTALPTTDDDRIVPAPSHPRSRPMGNPAPKPKPAPKMALRKLEAKKATAKSAAKVAAKVAKAGKTAKVGGATGSASGAGDDPPAPAPLLETTNAVPAAPVLNLTSTNNTRDFNRRVDEQRALAGAGARARRQAENARNPHEMVFDHPAPPIVIPPAREGRFRKAPAFFDGSTVKLPTKTTRADQLAARNAKSEKAMLARSATSTAEGPKAKK